MWMAFLKCRRVLSAASPTVLAPAGSAWGTSAPATVEILRPLAVRCARWGAPSAASRRHFRWSGDKTHPHSMPLPK